MVDKYSFKVKICLLGDSSVGKTSLIRRYVMDIFDDKYITTLGTKVSKKQLIINKGSNEINLMFSIWDVLGQKDFKKIQVMAFKGSKGALLVCDITRKETLDNLLTWGKRLKATTGEIPLIILANKSDLTDEYDCSEKDLKSYSKKLNAPILKTSAKFGDNVIRAFFNMGEVVINDLFSEDKP